MEYEWTLEGFSGLIQTIRATDSRHLSQELESCLRYLIKYECMWENNYQFSGKSGLSPYFSHGKRLHGDLKVKSSVSYTSRCLTSHISD